MISVVIVNYESGEHLGPCLDSVAPLLEAGHEVVVVDNGSRDGSQRAVAGRDGVELLRLSVNMGFGAASNRGAAETRGEHLLLLNPDARLDPDCAERLSAALARDARRGAVAPRLRYPDGRRQFTWEPTPSLLGEALCKLRNPFEALAWAHDPVRRLVVALGDPGWLTAACLLVRRPAWDEVGGFDEDYFLYFEDADLCLRLRAAGWTLALVPEAGAAHVRGRAAVWGPASELRYRESQFRFYLEHRGRRASRLLVRRQRRRFRRLSDPELRASLLAVCDRAEAALRSRES